MSWAGKRSLKESFRSLFKNAGQASSIPVSDSQAPSKAKPVIPILPQTVRRLDKLVSKWVEGKGYRMPDRTIEDAARRIGTDSATLYRYFQTRGEDFRTFRSRLRLEDAMVMLLENRETSASVIGQRVGFNDRANFTHQFKSHTGLTPDAWRKAHP